MRTIPALPSRVLLLAVLVVGGCVCHAKHKSVPSTRAAVHDRPAASCNHVTVGVVESALRSHGSRCR